MLCMQWVNGYNTTTIITTTITIITSIKKNRFNILNKLLKVSEYRDDL